MVVSFGCGLRPLWRPCRRSSVADVGAVDPWNPACEAVRRARTLYRTSRAAAL